MERENLRTRLLDNHLTFVWLVNLLRARGLAVDKSEMSSAVNGTRVGKKSQEIIETSHILLDKYESFVRSVV